MGRLRTTLAMTALAATSTWARITIPAVDGSLPAPQENGCAAGYRPGNHTTLDTVPYSYEQVLSTVGNYTDLTWSGSPANTVQTNNTDAFDTNNWTPGSGRFYDFAGAHFIETITQHQKPNSGAYVQVHTVAPRRLPSYSTVEVYSGFDAQFWVPVCDGRATAVNFTINFCSTNVAAATQFFDKMHSMAAMRVGQLLGGNEFTSCEDLGVRSYLKRALQNLSAPPRGG